MPTPLDSVELSRVGVGGVYWALRPRIWTVAAPALRTKCLRLAPGGTIEEASRFCASIILKSIILPIITGTAVF